MDIEEGTNGLQGINITGVLGGPLMCDNIIIRNNFKQDNQSNTFNENSSQSNDYMQS